ncbi:transcription factor with C2H2 and Zn(2)-Cys(6) DNA binding protein [Penicillium brasilianum]|uniref:Transcription factor with C2H2 and Zn(2)-Cys(6) DNA binding protein n=1 Tax=Penicillium brasilianum TaxID=104259 RepID=A0A1S9R832_PENBI|nr:transcription factor with C2H2 and Zn(2)-Cys(6) DNA binding protein [Penicillium brasilianum]
MKRSIRAFSPADSLRRHIRQDHSISEQHSARSALACNACRLAKTRCQGGAPCLQCRTKGQECTFDTTASTTSRSPSDEQVFAATVDTEVLMEDRTAQTKHYVDLYFEHFHPHWPILHRATFSIPDEPPLLLQAVLMIGLWVSEKPSARQAAVDLHQKLGLWIREQRVQWENLIPRKENGEEGPVSICPIATYQGILLYLIFSLIQESSTRSLSLKLTLSSSDYEILSVLVQVCRRNHVFYYPGMLERYQDVDSMACIWIGVEEMGRLGLAMYKVSSLCRAGKLEDTEDRLLQLSDLRFPVPDSRSLWDAKSDMELSQLLQLEAGRERLAASDMANWISVCGKALESGSERWWL